MRQTKKAVYSETAFIGDPRSKACGDDMGRACGDDDIFNPDNASGVSGTKKRFSKGVPDITLGDSGTKKRFSVF